MKHLVLILSLLFLAACKADEETLLVTSKVDCIVPDPVTPDIHFANEDSITVTTIVQLR